MTRESSITCYECLKISKENPFGPQARNEGEVKRNSLTSSIEMGVVIPGRRESRIVPPLGRKKISTDVEILVLNRVIRKLMATLAIPSRE